MNGILTTLLVMSPLNMGQMIQELKDWKSQQNRQPVEEMLNNTLDEFEDGNDDTAKQKELLQFQGSKDKQGCGWRHDRCDTRPWVQPDEEGTSENCRCGYPREEDEGQRREDPWDRRNELDEGEADRYDQR